MDGPREAESGFDAGTMQPRLAGLPGGAPQHASIISALHEFRKWAPQNIAGGGDRGSADRGNGKKNAATKGIEKATNPTLTSGDCTQIRNPLGCQRTIFHSRENVSEDKNIPLRL